MREEPSTGSCLCSLYLSQRNFPSLVLLLVNHRGCCVVLSFFGGAEVRFAGSWDVIMIGLLQ